MHILAVGGFDDVLALIDRCISGKSQTTLLVVCCFESTRIIIDKSDEARGLVCVCFTFVFCAFNKNVIFFLCG